MTLCSDCIHYRGCPATRYEPAEHWCDLDCDEFDMEDDEVIRMLEEKYGDDSGDYPMCEDYQDSFFDGPDPDREFDEYRDRMLEAGLDWRHP